MRTTLSAAALVISLGVTSPGTDREPARLRFHHRAVERDALRDELRAAVRAACGRRALRAGAAASAEPRRQLEPQQSRRRHARRRHDEPAQTIKSDFLLVQLGGDGEGWMPFRDTFEVKGSKLRERDDRLLKLFTSNDKDRVREGGVAQQRQRQAQSRQRRADHQHSNAGDDVPASARQRAVRVHRRRRGNDRRPRRCGRRSTRKWRGRR